MTPAEMARQMAKTRLSLVLTQKAMAAPMVVAKPAQQVNKRANHGSPSSAACSRRIIVGA